MVHSRGDALAVENLGMNTRRFLASLTLAASPVILVGCTGAEVQDFFASQGKPVSSEVAERIAKVVTMLEDKADRSERCRSDDSTTTTTTPAPPTTVAADGSYRKSDVKVASATGWHGDCGRRGRHHAKP